MIRGFHSSRVRWIAVPVVSVALLGVAAGSALASGHDAKSEHWGVIDRNTIGSPVAQLRDGPYALTSDGQLTSPPFGKGSLGIEVASGSEKVAFGNETDFFGDPVSGISQVGFQVFQTNEDVVYGGATNMPNITFEINPHVAHKVYTSMVWVPGAPGVTDAWSPYLDATATGYWYFTSGPVAAATHCGISNSCTLAQAQAALVAANDRSGDASVYTVAIEKGRDYQWQGAVDGLRINDTVYNFEADGVHAQGAK